MGMKCTHRCGKCGHSSLVSGGPDCGFNAVTQTYECLACKTLFDANIGTHYDEPSAIEERAKTRRCPSCRSRRIRPWNYPARFPVCGSDMERTMEEVILWD